MSTISLDKKRSVWIGCVLACCLLLILITSIGLSISNRASADSEAGSISETLLKSANEAMLKRGLNPEAYSVGTIDDSYPYALIEFHRTQERGIGSTRPVIYSAADHQTFYVVYQKEDGTDVVEEATLEGDPANPSVTSRRL